MTDSIPQCWDRALVAADSPEVQAEIQKEVQRVHAAQLLNKPTGVQTSGLNLKSNTTDFLPLIAMSGLLGDIKQGDTVGTYVFDLNFLLPGIRKDSKLRAVVNSQPKISDALKTQVPEAGRDEVVKKLEGGLSDLSDYLVSYTFGWTDRSHGRGFSQYRDRFNALAKAVPL